jgi:YD repeat-containing protein
MRHPDGWTRREVAYDPVGNPVGESYFDASGAPVRDKNGIGRFERAYDAWGNLIAVAYRDERDAATKWTNGCYRSTWRFNRRNNVIEETCLGADGEPAERNDGPHRVTVERDEQDRVTLRIFTALRIKSGWPTRTIREYVDEQGRFRRAEFVDDNGVVRQARDVDERGRTLVMAYFDEQGRPMLGPGGFAKSKVLAYDEFGGADMVFEDEHGAPVEPAILVKGVKEGGAGARAGLRVNDVILRYGGRDIHYGTLAAAQRAPGPEPRELVVLRGNSLETLQVEPGALQIEIEPVPRPKV